MEEILKRKKIYHVLRKDDGDEVKSVSEELIADDDGFEITHIISSRLCSCGKEVEGTDKIYVCQFCINPRNRCSSCAFLCSSCGSICCPFHAGFFGGRVYCVSCWRADIERLFREKRR